MLNIFVALSGNSYFIQYYSLVKYNVRMTTLWKIALKKNYVISLFN
jgi:hypothetical protein